MVIAPFHESIGIYSTGITENSGDVFYHENDSGCKQQEKSHPPKRMAFEKVVLN